MRTERLGWILCLALASMLAPTATAALSAPGGGLVHAEALAQTVLDALPPVEQSGRTGDDTPEPGDDGDAPDVQGTVAATQERAAEAAQPLVSGAVAAAQDARDDSIALVSNTVLQPVERTRADLEAQVGRIVFAPPPEPEQPAPAAEPQATAWAAATPFSDGLLLAAGAAATAGAVVILWLAGSSSTLGGAAATGAKVGDDLRRLLPYTSPLFSRFEKETVLGHPKREQLYALVMQSPGITLQDLCERTHLSRTAVTHHLRLLEQHHMLVSKRMGRSRHYYENGGRYGRDQKDAYAVLRNERSREVAQFIQRHPGTIQKDLCEQLGIQASVAHWHVRRLQEAQLVEPIRRGRTVSYYPSAPVPEIGA